MSILKWQIGSDHWIALDSDTRFDRLIEHDHGTWKVVIDGHDAVVTRDSHAMDAALRLLAPEFRAELIAFADQHGAKP